MITADFSSNKTKSKIRNTSFRYLTSINKISKEHSINISFPEKEEESKKNLKNTNDTFKSLKSEKLLLKLFSNNLSDNSINKKNTIPIKSNIGLYKENIFRTKYLKDKKYKTLKYFNHSNNLNEEKNLKIILIIFIPLIIIIKIIILIILLLNFTHQLKIIKMYRHRLKIE